MLTTSSAPAPIAANTLLVLRVTSAVTTRIAQGVAAMIRRVASTPSMTGMMRSMRITSGRSAAHRRTASAPSLATQATVYAGTESSARRSASTASGSSLTIAILTCPHR